MTTIARLAVVAAAAVVVLVVWAWWEDARQHRCLDRLLSDWTWAE